eukprot:CAMPEP_0204605694 /NCGR_PEP_ID=MMETSP0661-20131031/58640_1 /ASSEMBLY_ACC=CAM_ASM_000606 /TAXON_ID=109239 /ORGANISM="Alexandrium margalefi, Strain AMGDE01CS-322" /LENGTH=62 /DNA_ID=CAMNT_0051616953 /DNA_START=4 /DNA_END=189 /DNA_ORIENTATION=-
MATRPTTTVRRASTASLIGLEATDATRALSCPRMLAQSMRVGRHGGQPGLQGATPVVPSDLL